MGISSNTIAISVLLLLLGKLKQTRNVGQWPTWWSPCQI